MKPWAKSSRLIFLASGSQPPVYETLIYNSSLKIWGCTPISKHFEIKGIEILIINLFIKCYESLFNLFR